MILNIKKLLTSVDVLNTLHGGISEPFLSFVEHTNSRQIRVRVPGFDKYALQVEVNNNTLTVYYYIPVISSGETLQVPQVIHTQLLPYFIEISGITVTHEEQDLVVQLPFNSLHDGYNKKIELSEE